jgi:hypothetical protein
MPQTSTTIFDIPQTVFNALHFSVQTPLTTPALDISKPPIAITEHGGIPDHDAFRESINLLARPDDYQLPTRWHRKLAKVTTSLWKERHEDGCDVTWQVKGIFDKTDSLRAVLDGQVGCAELLFLSNKPLCAIGQFTAASPYNVSSIAVCAGIDMLKVVARHVGGARGKIWRSLSQQLAKRLDTGNLSTAFESLVGDVPSLVSVPANGGESKGLVIRSGRENDGYDPGLRLGLTHPFTAEFHPRDSHVYLMGRTLKFRTITIKQDLTNGKGDLGPHALAIQEFMAAAAALYPSLFSARTE